MNRNNAERIIAAYVQPLFGFALKRCKNLHDAEDLSQEIILKSFRALLNRDDIADANKFIWVIAHNTLSNYYRSAAKETLGISLEEVADTLPASSSSDDTADEETLCRLREAVAYLSKQQRAIVIAYYFENRKQADIAQAMGLPLGTVKWHLFEAKKELKRGIDIMREPSQLKFNPIRFDSFGINGSCGTKMPEDFLRSALSQNLCYCVRNTSMTINEIAAALGVSPVYIENEAEYLEKYGLLSENKGQYIANFIIHEPTAELLTMQNDMYRQAADLFANDLYAELTESVLLDDPDILCQQANTADNTRRHFILWTLIPWLAACSGDKLMEKSISFHEVATLRPDGAHNLYSAQVLPDNLHLPDNYVAMKNWCGPIWNGRGNRMLWHISSQWHSYDEFNLFQYQSNAQRVLALYEQMQNSNTLSENDCIWLAQHGLIRLSNTGDILWMPVILKSKRIQSELLAIGDRLKEKHASAFRSLKAPYVAAMMRAVPAHLQKQQAYPLQFIFHSDGYFLLHCITALLRSGKLHEPSEDQRASLMTLIAYT